MLSQEAKRLHHVFYFRGTITSSMIAYTSGMSEINPMEEDYGGVNLPFEATREEYDGFEPSIEIQCSRAFIIYAQSYLSREFPEYRCISYPIIGEAGICTVRVYFIKQNKLPTIEILDIEGSDVSNYPDYMYMNDYFHIMLIGDDQMELMRYNMYYRDQKLVFDEADCDKVVPDIWELLKKKENMFSDYSAFDVITYEELVTVIGMAHSTDAWKGTLKRMVLDNELALSKMIGTRDDVYLYLIKKGLNSRDAYFIMESVRKGKSLSKELEELLRDIDVEDWFMKLCKQVKYLFPKAHITQEIRKYAYCLKEVESL